MPTVTVLNFANAPATTLASSINNAATSLQVATGAAAMMPSTFPFILILDKDQPTEEVVLATSSGGVDTFNVTRGHDSTTAFAHAAGSIVSHGVSALVFRETNQHMAASAAVHGVNGNVVGTTDAQTLTNKTLSTGTVLQAGTTINSPAINNPVITGGTLQDNVVVKGNPSNSVDPLKFMKSDNTVQYGGVDRQGRVSGSALWATGADTEQVTLLVKSRPAQTSSLVSYIDSAGTHVGEVTTAGKVGVGVDANSGIQHLIEATANSNVTQRIRRKTGQTGNLWQVVTEGSLVLASVDKDGNFFAGNVTPGPWTTIGLTPPLAVHDHIVRVRLVGDRVEMEGTIERPAPMDGAAGFVLFNLPGEFTPASVKKFTGQATLTGTGTSGACRVEIHPGGNVEFWSQDLPDWIGLFGSYTL